MMEMIIKKGVTLHVIPTEKFKTIRLLIRFSTPVTADVINKRTLLSSVLETNSAAYPTQQAMSEYLANLYGTSFGISVGRKGKSHYFSVILNTVNDNYLKESDDVLAQSIHFLGEVLFNPNMTEQGFDEQTFDREKHNLIEYIQSVYDDKQSQAALRLQELFFSEDISQGMPSFGEVQGVESLSASDLAAYYQEMIATDNVDIFVLGDVSTERVVDLVSAMPFDDRQDIVTEEFYKEPIKAEIQIKEEILPVTQAKLNLGYHVDAYYYEANYFPLVVFNGLFGGFAHSKLFMNVREKESMAYYASSTFDSFRGYLTVQTGIESGNKDRVLALIEDQLESLQAGEISPLELAQTKEMLKNQYITSQDNPAAVIEGAYIQSKYPKSAISESEWLAEVEKITVEDVQEVAQKVSLQGIYFMKGGVDHEGN